MRVDFATFCYSGDAEKLHAPDQLAKQVNSNGWQFNNIIVIHQGCNSSDYLPFGGVMPVESVTIRIDEIDQILTRFNLNLDGQYSGTDRKHSWKYHVVNHLRAVEVSDSDFIVFADADCWIINQQDSWVKKGIEILQADQNIFIVSPNDGEPERITQRMSQQMFLTRTKKFRRADFNQPGWDGNVNIPGGPMPEYWGMLEGRIELWCRMTGKYRYVLGPNYRYWHHQW